MFHAAGGDGHAAGGDGGSFSSSVFQGVRVIGVVCDGNGCGVDVGGGGVGVGCGSSLKNQQKIETAQTSSKR